MTKFLRGLVLALATLALFDAHAQKISADPTASTLAGSEYLAGVQSGANVKVLPSQIQTLTLTAPTTTGKLTTAASTTSAAGFRLPHGAAPTSPVNGDVWTTSAGGLYAFINGSTVGPFGAAGGTVTSVGLSVPTFLSVSGSPITTSGTLAVTLSGTALPVANGGTGSTSPALVAGTNVTITGSWPNQTINASGGGGSLSDWTEGVDSSTPNGTIPVVSFSATNAATNVDAAVVPKGTGGFALAVADNSTTGGNKRGDHAIDLQVTRSSAAQVASGSRSVVIGTNSEAQNTDDVAIGRGSNASGGNSTAIGTSAVSSGAGSIAIGGSSGATASGVNSVAIGGNGAAAVASGTGSVTIGGGSPTNAGALAGLIAGNGNSITSGGSKGASVGGESNIVSGQWAGVYAGQNNTASAESSGALFGNDNLADGISSLVMGEDGRSFGVRNAFVRGGGLFASGPGESQTRDVIVQGITTTTTPKELFVAGGRSAGLSAATIYALPSGMASVIRGKCSAFASSAGDAKGWEFVGLLTNISGTTSLVATVTPTVVAATGGASSWSIAVTADAPFNGLAVTVTGPSGVTVHWTCDLGGVDTK